MIGEVRMSANVAVQEAKIKLAEDIENVRSWNIAGWREALRKLTGKHDSTNQDPKKQQQKVGEEEMVTGDDN